MGKAIVVAAIVVSVAFVIVALVVVTKRLIEGPDVRRRQLRRAQWRYKLAEEALEDVSELVTFWRDTDSPLVAALQPRLTKYAKDVKELTS